MSKLWVSVPPRSRLWRDGVHIHLTEHAVVLERVRERTQRLDEALQRAQDAGLLKTFNIVTASDD
jgi:hypothetical protein